MQAFFTLLSKIQKEQFSPVYLLSGNESFYIDAILKALTDKLVHEASKDFDYSLFYGKEAQASEIIETAKRYPMLSQYNVVVVKEAQFMNVSQFDLLATYAAQPMPQTVVVICYKNKPFDKRKKLYKAIEKSGVVLTVKPLYDNQLAPWISDQARVLKLQMEPVAIELLVAYIGANLSRLESEMKKLKLVVADGEIVSREHIEKYIGISKEFNSFELQKAIGIGQFSKAFQIIQYLTRNPKDHPLVLTLATLHAYFQKLLLLKGIGSDPKSLGISPYFIKEYQVAANRFSIRQLTQAMEFVMETDLKSKGIDAVNQSPKEILETLLLKLFSL